MTPPDFKTADLCDEYEGALQIIDPGYRGFGGKAKFYGEISTVKCFEDNSRVRQQLSTPGRGRVLVVDAAGSNRCAMLGDLLAAMAIQNGWSGIIMHGMIRDSEDIGQMPIGVMALGTHPRKSEKHDIGDIDIEIDFSGVRINPGDWVYADHDGIIVAQQKLL
jgi:regulator of ribonuclease activity A